MSENKGVASGSVDAVPELAHDATAGGSEAMTTPTGKRTTSPAFQFYPNDFLGSTKVQQMSATEVGAYWLLICACWLDGSLPTDMKRLARIARMKPQQFERMWNSVLGECFDVRGDRLVNPRLEKERKKQTEYRRRQSDAAALRWDKRRNATAMPATYTPHASGNALQSSSSISSSSTSVKNTDVPRARAPIVDQREHRKHAVCGRVCLHASLFGEFVRRRNHADADSEVRTWAGAVLSEWSDRPDEPGDPFDFWRTRYEEKWPPVKAKKRNALDEWVPPSERSAS